MLEKNRRRKAYMTKFLVCSDIHGREIFLEAALKKHSDTDAVIVCGDLELEFYDVEEIIRRCLSRSTDIRMVRGNCDMYITSSSSYLDTIAFPLSSRHRALVTHGHIYRARTDLMTYAAMEKNCDIVLFGHTHRQTDRMENGIRFLNPGAMKNREYMILETDKDGELTVTFYPELI